MTFFSEINLTNELPLSLVTLHCVALSTTPVTHLLGCSSTIQTSCIDCGVSMTDVSTDGFLGLFD
jgi:hypothetical protein